MADTAALSVSEPVASPAVSFRRMADALRVLAADTVAIAGSGDLGLPLGMADAASVLWTRFLKFDAADPRWPDRDRFVLSAGHGAVLLYALLHLTGHAGMEAEELTRFRRLHAATGGHPSHGEHPAIEVTTGPAGQGFASAVGMALAERMMASRFGRSLVDHRTWVIAAQGDLLKGASHEAAALAGDLRLEKLTVLYADPRPEPDEPVAATGTDQLRRFAAYGWTVRQVDGHDVAQLVTALSLALRSKRPMLIACRVGDDRGLGAAGRSLDAAAVRQAVGWTDPPFVLPDAMGERWLAAGMRSAGARRAWLKRQARHVQRAEFERVLAGRLPDLWHEALAELRADIADTRPTLSTAMASQRVQAALAPAVPELAGGSADPVGAPPEAVHGMAAIAPGSFAGRHLDFGTREHGLAACLNGMALHGGVIAHGGAPFVSTDAMRPALRIAALMRQRVIYTLTDDSIGVGEDGAAHQPVEQLAALRAMPDVHVFRPADALETVECWELALRRPDGPSLLVLARQALPGLRADTGENRSARGGYVLAEAEGARQVTIVATGSEVAIAMDAREALGTSGIAAAVVSLPCWELFALQEEPYRAAVLGGVPRVGVEAASGFGWERWLGDGGVFVGMAGFGASAPYEELYRHFGITPEAVAAAARKRLEAV